MATENNNKNLNVPNLRFPEFSGEWRHVALSEIAARVTRKNKDNASQLPLTISAQYGLVDQISFFNKVVASADMSNYYLLRQGEFAYNKSYSSDYPWGAIKRLDRYLQGALSSLYICFAVNDKVDSDLAVHYFESSKWHREVSNIAGEGARNHGLLNIAVGDFFDTKHRLPSCKEEQKKIAALLNLITERIATQIKIIEKLESLIKGIYERLFNIDGAAYIQLGNVAKIHKGQQINGEELSETGSYYVMNGGVVPSGYLEDFNTPANTISISEGGNSCGYVQYNGVPFWSGGHCYTLIDPITSFNYKYLFHYLKFKEQSIMALRIGSGLPNIQKKDLDSFPILNISKEEQDTIACVFDEILEKIVCERQIALKYEEQKRYLLSNLFI